MVICILDKIAFALSPEHILIIVSREIFHGLAGPYYFFIYSISCLHLPTFMTQAAMVLEKNEKEKIFEGFLQYMAMKSLRKKLFEIS